jgi:hypothetical protein
MVNEAGQVAPVVVFDNTVTPSFYERDVGCSNAIN